MYKPVFSTQFLISTTIIASLYIILVTLFMNSSLARDTLVGGYGLDYKITVLISLLQGMWTAMSGSGVIMLFLIALLTGANLTLLFSKVRLLKNNKRLRLVVGGNSLLGIVGSGCAACGLPILSLLGLGGSVMYLPFRGGELSYLALILLSVSLYLLLKNSNQACSLAKKTYEY